MYLWVKAFHLISMVTWFAALFYLPRLYVYHASASDPLSLARFKLMERKLYFGIMGPGAVLTIAFGLWLIGIRGLAWFNVTYWLHVKLVLVGLLVGYHAYLGHLRKLFAVDANPHSEKYYRWLNEAPVVTLVGAIILAVVKPWS